jgi:hypothetical protein
VVKHFVKLLNVGVINHTNIKKALSNYTSMQTSLVRWRIRPFFTYCWTSLKNIVAFGFRILRIVIPNSLQGVAWAIRTAVKLFVLFFGLMILLVGPRLGFPRSIHQVHLRLQVTLQLVICARRDADVSEYQYLGLIRLLPCLDRPPGTFLCAWAA